MRRNWIILLLVLGTLSGCQLFERKHNAGVAVELNGNYIYQSALDSLTMGLEEEDSVRVAQQYITQWAKDILFYEKAKAYSNADIESLVEDYRRSLYAQAYEHYLVERRMPKTVMDSTIQEVYAAMPERFKLEETILKGIILIIPSGAPQDKKLRTWLNKLEDKDELSPETMDEVEKYAYQYADGYEIFTDRWLTASEVLAQVPLDRTTFENQLRQNKQIEVNDSTKTYLLQVLSKHMRGEQMPIDYAKPSIEQIILNQRQVEFLQKERMRLYDEAIQSGKIKINRE